MKRPVLKAACMLLLLTAAFFTVVSCARKPKEIKLTVWINGADSVIGPTEQQKPQDEWYISQAFKRFEKANPGVTIELIVPPNQGDAHTNFKTQGLAGNAPDVANLWTGQPIFAMKEVILPLDKLVPADDLKKIVGWESVRDGFTADGTILGYPAAQNQICHMLYNKAIVKKAGHGLGSQSSPHDRGVQRSPRQDQGDRRDPHRRGRGGAGRALVLLLGG